MKRYFLKISCAVGLLLFVNLLYGEHIIGGEITYECLGDGAVPNTHRYRIVMKIYRDCQSGGADFDSAPGGAFPATVTIFQIGVTAIRRFELKAPRVNRIDFAANSCFQVPDYICVEEGIYEFEATLPVSDLSYFVSYQRCCRNPTISNINNPNRTGATYYVEITPQAQAVCNNSPEIPDFPPVVVCVNTPLAFSQAATDAEGDSIVYELCAPLLGGGINDNPVSAIDGIAPDPESPPPYNNTVVFTQPTFSLQNPLGRSANFKIDSSTGLITGIPNIQGQFVTAVCVSEYRNDTLLSVTRRDFQINVVTCLPAVLAKVQADSTMEQSFFITSCGENELEFLNQSVIRENIFDQYWIFQIGDDTLRVDDWDARVTFPGAGVYTGQLILNPNTLCGDTANIRVDIKPEIFADFELTYDTCTFGDVRFQDQSESGSGQIVAWNWTFGDGQNSSTTDPTHRYNSVGEYNIALRVKDINACEATAEQTIAYYPLPNDLNILPDVVLGCNPQLVRFEPPTTLLNDAYSFDWDFGDGEGSDQLAPSHTYQTTGTYSVRLKVISPTGCQLEASLEDAIGIEPSPTADFFYEPEQVTTLNANVRFTDASLFANTHEWQFGQNGTAFNANPTYTFQDTGLQIVTLRVTHVSGCVDTISKIIDVVPIVQVYIPNAFSPNSDSANDTFKMEGLTTGIENFSLTIWNRWGELVYSTKNLDESWDGSYLSKNKNAPEGIYTYLIQFKAPRGRLVEYAGDLQLIR